MEMGGTTYAGGRLGLFDENPPSDSMEIGGNTSNILGSNVSFLKYWPPER